MSTEEMGHSAAGPRPDVVARPAPDPGLAHPRLTLRVACLGFFLITLDATVVNVSLPAIGHQFGGAVNGLQWVVDVYTLMFAALLLSSGALADRIGASRSYMAGLVGFTVASALCGFAPVLGVLIVCRALQGVAAAVMLPSSLAIVRTAFPDAVARARAIAVWTAAGGVAVAAGPVVGGALTTWLGWRAIFFLNLPLGVLGVLAMTRVGRSAARPVPLDAAGQLIAMIGLAGVTFTVIQGGAHGFGSLPVVLAMVLTVLAVVAFPIVESRAAHPVVPLRLFGNPTVAMCVVIGFVLNFATYGLIFLISLYLQQQRHDSAAVAGLMFLPMTGVIAAVNMLSGRMVARFGHRLPIVVGHCVLAAGLLGLLLGGTTTVPSLLLLLVPIGIGGGMTVPPIAIALLDAVDATSAGLAAGILNAGRQVGSAIAVALFGLLLAGAAGFEAGMRLALLISVVALLASLVGAVVLLRRPGGAR